MDLQSMFPHTFAYRAVTRDQYKRRTLTGPVINAHCRQQRKSVRVSSDFGWTMETRTRLYTDVVVPDGDLIFINGADTNDETLGFRWEISESIPSIDGDQTILVYELMN
jgi:hypothetical protein